VAKQLTRKSRTAPVQKLFPYCCCCPACIVPCGFCSPHWLVVVICDSIFTKRYLICEWHWWDENGLAVCWTNIPQKFYPGEQSADFKLCARLNGKGRGRCSWNTLQTVTWPTHWCRQLSRVDTWSPGACSRIRFPDCVCTRDFVSVCPP
jgi:hypothetical protein